ncbi:MAG: hypothetical protein M1818_003371 [Claussenomyces sp. TS43310]|nr:MAG: hypothetical protein M1818_003371 [Claussenomyces sp. TS43310]
MALRSSVQYIPNAHTPPLQAVKAEFMLEYQRAWDKFKDQLKGRRSDLKTLNCKVELIKAMDDSTNGSLENPDLALLSQGFSAVIRDALTSAPTYYPTTAVVALGTHAILQYREFPPIVDISLFLLSNVGLSVYLKNATPAESIALLQVKINALYFAVLFLSVATYRRFFHRCRAFPGPFWASITKFWAFYTVNTGEYHRVVRKLHQKHGDFVRVGPREIDICNVEAITPIFGVGTKCLKGPFYEGSVMGREHRFLQNENPQDHSWKRRIWDAGFNSKAIRGYEPHVLGVVDQLIAELKRHGEKTIDIGLYFSFFTFDIMGVLGFGKSFDMLKNGKEHDYMTIVQGFAKFGALISTIPWCSSLFAWLPKSEAAEGLFTFATERVKERLPLGDSPPDVFSTLLAEDRVTKKRYIEPELVLESLMLSIGVMIGSDTTSSSLVSIIYLLLAYPDKYEKLKQEIHLYDGPLNHHNLAKFAYLNAVVKEALRLLPPIGSGLMHRVTPPEGLTIEGVYIPGNTTVGIGAYELQRDPRYYGQPDNFIPERWLGEGPLPFNRNAFMAFSYGPYSCVGKHLAYMELCDVIATIVKTFDIELDPKYDISSYETSIKDAIISTRAHLPVILKARA